MADESPERDPRAELPHDLSLLFEAFRREFDAKITGLKYWGIAMTLGSGTLGGVVAGLKPHQTADVLGYVSALFV